MPPYKEQSYRHCVCVWVRLLIEQGEEGGKRLYLLRHASSQRFLGLIDQDDVNNLQTPVSNQRCRGLIDEDNQG